MNHKTRNVSRGRYLTPEEVAKYQRLRAEIEVEKPTLIARLRDHEASGNEAEQRTEQ